MPKKSIAIIGGGSAALMLAATLDNTIFNVTLYEKNKTLGRKFLVAGDGGFNLTHSEEIDSFINKYTPNAFLKQSLLHFTNEDFRAWLQAIGIETFVGTSKKVYPKKGIKPIKVLNAILKVLETNKATIKTKHEWRGWNDEGKLLFNNDLAIEADIIVFALGGASWSVTGSNGTWLPLFEKKSINTEAFRASNCEYTTHWSNSFSEKWQGQPLKNIAITCNEIQKKGEIVITKNGIEGGAIYALSPSLRTQLQTNNCSEVFIDLKPALLEVEILSRLENKGKKNTTELLKTELNLPQICIALLKELVSKDCFNNMKTLANAIKKLPLNINNFGPIEKAISTVGGISLNEVSGNFELNKYPNHFVIGEMLNWDAPTGGYLLQGCMSMGNYLGHYLNNNLNNNINKAINLQ
jgi:uncharacterized flavoprotein (TIGR03862 family)